MPDDDFDLCDTTYWKIVSHYGEDLRACDLPVIHRTVLLVWHSYGIIDNGGFDYLFSGNLEGDPDYTLTCKSFDIINCSVAYESFKEALAIFPDKATIIDLNQRKQFIESYPDEIKDVINAKFWSVSMGGTDEIKILLAAYIREHKESFSELN